jgi:hypothetical protein
MEVNGQLHVPAASYSGRNAPYMFDKEAGDCN